ncbi:PD-(D/E)XK nuclease family protein [Myceligenerans crystallogenes]|uniref:PD-(D/E)XK endonuclease-like domain-containing protein n=1 Tax=Myceligenerans crystallogenes TaxID=316335 RepID=A0ABP4ZYC8_9MICO
MLLGLFFDVLDAVEADGKSVTTALEVLPDGVGGPERNWIANAVHVYPDMLAEGLRPVQDHWVIQTETATDIRELYAWGRRYESADGRTRVLVLPSMSTATRRPAGDVKTAVSACTTAWGRPAPWPKPSKWSEPFAIRGSDADLPTLVSVRQVGLLDGSVVELFDGTPEEAMARYEQQGRAAVKRAVAGGQPAPGNSCSGCKLIDDCIVVPRVPGLLGVADPEAPVRSVSATTLRYHDACPQQARLRGLNMPAGDTEPQPIRIGRAVDAALNTLHGQVHEQPCTREQLDSVLTDHVAGLDESDAELVVGRLRRHVDTCSRHGGCEITDEQPQARITAFDPNASVVIYADPDLLYRENGELVWRETTASWAPPSSRRHLFETRKGIQLALAVLLCHAGALGEPVARVEMEYLTDRGADLRFLDVSDPETVAAARAVIEPIAARWRADGAFPATPGAACGSCSFTRWCPDAAPERTPDA